MGNNGRQFHSAPPTTFYPQHAQTPPVQKASGEFSQSYMQWCANLPTWLHAATTLKLSIVAEELSLNPSQKWPRHVTYPQLFSRAACEFYSNVYLLGQTFCWHKPRQCQGPSEWKPDVRVEVLISLETVLNLHCLLNIFCWQDWRRPLILEPPMLALQHAKMSCKQAMLHIPASQAWELASSLRTNRSFPRCRSPGNIMAAGFGWGKRKNTVC